jgi:hypothetical protein
MLSRKQIIIASLLAPRGSQPPRFYSIEGLNRLKMVLLFASPSLKRFYAPRCSMAYLFSIVSSVLVIILPYLLCFNRGEMHQTIAWLRWDSYREQPRVHFNYKTIMMFQATDTDTKQVKQLFSSSIRTFNNSSNNFRPASISYNEHDYNLDGVVDRIHISGRLPLKNESLKSLQIIVFVDYSLTKHVKIDMESMIYFDYHGSYPGTRLDLTGDLILRQNAPIRIGNTSVDIYKDESLLEYSLSSSSLPDSEKVQRILNSFQDRDVATDFHKRFSVWTPRKEEEISNSFDLNLNIDIPKLQPVIYIPTFYEALLEFWMRYLSLLIIFILLLRLLSGYLYEYQILRTKICYDKPV